VKNINCNNINQIYIEPYGCNFRGTERSQVTGAVYCNQSCCLCVCGSVTTITQNCVNRSSPKRSQTVKPSVT